MQCVGMSADLLGSSRVSCLPIVQPRASLPEVQRAQDEHLSRLSGLLDEQRKIGSTIHGALRNQNMQVEDL